MQIIRPPDPITETIAAIRCGNVSIACEFAERRDDFRRVVKGFGCRWNGSYWHRSVGKLSGRPSDRAVELGRLIVAHRFVVSFGDEELARRAIAGEYEPECKRWVLTGNGEYSGWFRLWWGYGEDQYAAALLVTGSRYDPVTRSVVAPSEQFDEVIDFAEARGFRLSDEAKRLVEDAMRLRASAYVLSVEPPRSPDDPEPAPVLKRHEETGALGRLRDFRCHDFKTTTELMPHQHRPVEKLMPLTVGALFMDMGLGKTRVAIEMIGRRRQRWSRVVWFCPVSLKETAAAEFRKHTTLPDETIYMFDDETNGRTVPDALVYIVGLESISSSDRVTLVASSLIDPNTFVVVDESSYIKGHASRRTRRVTQMAERARYRLILTGTPLSQGVEDLFAQMRFLEPGILDYRSFYSFSRNHLVYSDKYPGLVVRTLNLDYLAGRVEPYVYQVTKDECGIDLPAKRYDARYFSMTNEQRDAYNWAKDEILMSALDNEIDSYVIFRLFTALQQIACGFWNRRRESGQADLLTFEHRRIEMLMATLEAIPETDKVIVWSKYQYSIGEIVAALTEAHGAESVSEFHGRIPERERGTQLDRFRNAARFLVASQATGGHGLTLNEAHYAVFYSNEFKYSNRLQAEDRIHRIGQEHAPTYIDLTCSRSIDERIARALAEKKNVVQEFKDRVSAVKDKAQIRKLVEEL